MKAIWTTTGEFPIPGLDGSVEIRDSDGMWIGNAHGSHASAGAPEGAFPTDEQGKAHAYLMAAAPDMFMALQNLMITYDGMTNGIHWDEVRRVLKQAEGK